MARQSTEFFYDLLGPMGRETRAAEVPFEPPSTPYTMAPQPSFAARAVTGALEGVAGRGEAFARLMETGGGTPPYHVPHHP